MAGTNQSPALEVAAEHVQERTIFTEIKKRRESKISVEIFSST
jgi:hypothetical protein